MVFSRFKRLAQILLTTTIVNPDLIDEFEASMWY